MATKVEKLSSGNYRVRTSYVDETGKQRFKSFTAETPKEVKLLASQFEVERKHNAKPENITLSDAIERYISNREYILSPSTVVGYNQLKKNAYSSIIDMRIGYITKEDIQKAINEYAKEHSPKSVRNALGLISVALKELYPSLDVNGVKLPQKRNTEVAIPTPDEVKIMLEAAKGKEMYLPLLMALYTGERRSELFALTWDDIDFEQNKITINKATVRNKDGVYVIKQTKTTNSTRKVPLPKPVKDELELRQQEGKENIFDIGIETFDNRYKLMMKRIGLKYNFHSVRHYYISVLHRLGVPNQYAMKLTGHATDNMLKKVYQHTMKDEQQAIAAKVEEFFNK